MTFIGHSMKSLVSILCLLLCGCAGAQLSTVAVIGVTVVDVRDGSLHPERTVLVAGNRIAAVGPVNDVAVPSETFREFQAILRPIPPLELENVRLAHEAGVVLLAGTDVGVPFQVPGLGLHEELARLVEAGLTPFEALQTATLNPARVLDMAASLGTIEAGKLADMVLLDADPLEDIRNTRKIQAVVADGRLYRRSDLDQLLAGIGRLDQH